MQADLEDKILYLMSNNEGNILDNTKLIETLAASKVTSNEVNEQLKLAAEAEKEIDETREGYRYVQVLFALNYCLLSTTNTPAHRPTAYRASLLFFCVADLSSVDPMYQFSLVWYINLFKRACDNSPKSEDVVLRTENLNNYFTFALYQVRTTRVQVLLAL